MSRTAGASDDQADRHRARHRSRCRPRRCHLSALYGDDAAVRAARGLQAQFRAVRLRDAMGSLQLRLGRAPGGAGAVWAAASGSAGKPKLTQHQIAEAISRRDAGEALAEIGRSWNGISPHADQVWLYNDEGALPGWGPVLGAKTRDVTAAACGVQAAEVSPRWLPAVKDGAVVVPDFEADGLTCKRSDVRLLIRSPTLGGWSQRCHSAAASVSHATCDYANFECKVFSGYLTITFR
jgi:hypothetical protein